MTRRTVCLLLLLPALLWAQTTEKKSLTPESMVAFDAVSSGAISPDGSRVVYVKSSVDLATSATRRSLWMVDVAAGRTWRFTTGDGNESAPRWSPDGKTIAFISTRTYRSADGSLQKGAQLWIIPADFGEAEQLTTLEEGINDYRWSPEGAFIYIQNTESRTTEAEAAYQAKQRRKDDAIVVDRDLFREQFLAFSLADRSVRTVAVCHPGIDGFEVSPDGSRIVYATNYTGRMDDDLSFDLWLLNTSDGALSQLTAFPGPETGPVWSPDGKTIAYISTTTPDIEYAQSDITLIAAAPGSSPNVLTGGFDRAVSDLTWHSSGQIFCSVEDGMHSPLYRLDPAAAAPAMARVPTGDLEVGSFDVDDAGTLLVLAEKYPSLPDFYLLKGSEAPHRLTAMADQLAPYAVARQRVITWIYEGQTLEAVLVLPADWKEGQRLPAILHCHGGPYGRVTNTFNASWQAFAAAGYAVVAPNYRGSSGYSEAFAMALKNDFGGVDYRDSVSAVDEIIRLGIADPDRLAVTGGSWGGYLTNWIVTQTDRFKAAVSLFGVFSFRTDMSNSIQSTFERMYFGGYYWEGNPKYDERSPQTHVTNIKTPMLIMHGEVDPLTFIANSNELYTALRLMGRTVEYIKYPREGHGFREPNHRIDYIRRSVEWFDRFVKVVEKNRME